MAELYEQIRDVKASMDTTLKKANKAIEALVSSNFRCVTGAKLSNQLSILAQSMNKAETSLCEAYLDVQQMPGAIGSSLVIEKYKFSASQSKSALISINYSEAQANVSVLKSAATALTDNVKTIKTIKSTVSGMSYTSSTEEKVLDVVSTVDSALHGNTFESNSKQFAKHQSSAVSNLEVAAVRLQLISGVFSTYASKITELITAFQKADTTVQKKVIAMKKKLTLAKTSAYTESNASSNKKSIKESIEELEALQAEYKELYGEESKEIAEEIARLKDLYESAFGISDKVEAMKKQDQFKQGTLWDNSNYVYKYKGEYIDGTGCCAMAFMMQIELMGGKGSAINSKNYEDIQVGDVIYISSGHFVCVLAVNEDGTLDIGEGSYHPHKGDPGIVNYRQVTKETLGEIGTIYRYSPED